METIENFERKQAEELVRKRVKSVRNFYIHLCIYIIAASIYVAKKYYGIHFSFRPIGVLNTFVMVIWTVIIIMDAIKVFVIGAIFGRKWEERKIKELTENKKQKQIWK
jgi:uncharacterized Tic20 family protein